MMDQEFFARERDHLGFLERQPRIVVADDKGDRRDEFQFQFNHRIANIARMQDVPDAREQLGDFWIQKSVRVGDDANLHAGRTGSTSP